LASQKQKFFVRDATGLTRALTATDALIGNLCTMGIGFSFLYVFFSALLYPGVNLPLTALFALVPGILLSLVYYYFTVAMPRTGGDFVWTSRVFHPAIGFLVSFYITFTGLTILGTVAGWVPVYGLGPMFAALAISNNDPSLLNLATTVSSPPTSFIIGVVLVSLFVLPLLLRSKSTFRVLWLLFIITVIGSVVTVAAFFSTPNSVFVTNFNQLSGMNYASAISKAGLAPGFTLTMTLTGSIFTMLDFIGFNFSAYYAGEVKKGERSQLIAMIGAVIIFAIFLGIIFYSANYSAGSDFINALSYLSGSGSSAYTLGAPPELNYLVVFANPSPWVVILSGLSFIATCLALITVQSFWVVRNFFAWSFDRILPAWFVKMDSRRNSPYIAVIATWILGIIFAALFIYTVFFQYLVFSVINYFVAFGVTALAAVWFPYRRKDIFDASPSIVKKKVGNVPVMSIVGVAGFLISAFLAYATIQPAVTPPPTGPPLVQALAYAFVPLTGVFALLIYALAYITRKREGFDMSLAFKELPPE